MKTGVNLIKKYNGIYVKSLGGLCRVVYSKLSTISGLHYGVFVTFIIFNLDY